MTLTPEQEAIVEDCAEQIREAHHLAGWGKMLPIIAGAIASAVEPVQNEVELWKTENDSRAIWIQKMCQILGYDNSDGFHSIPDPFEIATKLKAHSEDSARLDWLETMSATGAIFDRSRPDINICGPNNHGGMENGWLVTVEADRDLRPFIEKDGATLREAIDTARKDSTP